mmetsp:Transcript_46770/g.99962  ORF Transcript_46770/g.99962 Transcript_46770/m.99962 type:complete len:316 (+) Transcript_46770:68-1015(+)
MLPFADVYNTILYFMGPFFCNPAKPLLQSLWCKTGYEVAYEHFKRDHTNPTNLALHAVALAFQITSNFAFIHRLDELIGSPSWGVLSSSTAVLWAGLLAPQPAPGKARALALALIAAGYALRRKVAENWEYYTWGNAFIEAYSFKIGVRGLLPKDFRRSYFPLDKSFTRFLVGRLGLQVALKAALKNRTLVGKGVAANVTLPMLVWASYKPFFRQGFRTTNALVGLQIFNYMYLGWIMSLITGEKAFYLHSAAFTASNIQGIAHYLGKQEGTLPQLNDSHYEFAHCSYFPVLAVHRIFEHLGARALIAASAAAKA